METDLIGVSANIARVRELIQRIADAGLNTVVCGETGVGKELVVTALYQKSERNGGPFVKVNISLSNRLSGKAAQFTLTNGPPFRSDF